MEVDKSARVRNWIAGALALLGASLYTGCKTPVGPTNSPPVVSITSNKQTAVAGDKVTFTVQASDDGSVQSEKVAFGDGADTTLVPSGNPYTTTVSHTYSSPGSFTATATMRASQALARSWRISSAIPWQSRSIQSMAQKEALRRSLQKTWFQRSEPILFLLVP